MRITCRTLLTGAVTALAYRGTSGAYFYESETTQTKNLYIIRGAINESYKKTLAVYGGQPVQVQLRDRRNGKAIGLGATRLRAVPGLTEDGTSTHVYSYEFDIWMMLKPGWAATSNMRLILNVKGKRTATSWAQTF